MAMISDWIMSLRKCEKLIAPRTSKRVSPPRDAAAAVVAMLFSISCFERSAGSCRRLRTLLASSLSVLRECADETFRAPCFFAQARNALGRARVHRRHRLDRVSRGDGSGGVSPAVA